MTEQVHQNKQYKAPRAVNLGKAEIIKMGESMAAALNLEPGFDIDKLITAIGGKIIYKDKWEWENFIDGAIVVDGEDDFTVYIPRYTGPLRDRFTIAHELGHYVLHSECGKQKIKAARGSREQPEREADWFAVGLLMPESSFKREWEQNKSLARITSTFQVSRTAAQIRIKSLTAK